MQRAYLVQRLNEFLKDDKGFAVFTAARYLKYITEEEFYEALHMTGKERYRIRDMLAMFMLLAEGGDF